MLFTSRKERPCPSMPGACWCTPPQADRWGGCSKRSGPGSPLNAEQPALGPTDRETGTRPLSWRPQRPSKGGRPPEVQRVTPMSWSGVQQTPCGHLAERDHGLHRGWLQSGKAPWSGWPWSWAWTDEQIFTCHLGKEPSGGRCSLAEARPAGTRLRGPRSCDRASGQVGKLGAPYVGCAVGKGTSLPGLGVGGCGGPGRGAPWGVLAHMGPLMSNLFPPMGRVGALVAGPQASRRSSSDLQSPRPGLGGRTSQVRLLELPKKNRPLCLRVTPRRS